MVPTVVADKLQQDTQASYATTTALLQLKRGEGILDKMDSCASELIIYFQETLSGMTELNLESTARDMAAYLIYVVEEDSPVEPPPYLSEVIQWITLKMITAGTRFKPTGRKAVRDTIIQQLKAENTNLPKLQSENNTLHSTPTKETGIIPPSAPLPRNRISINPPILKDKVFFAEYMAEFENYKNILQLSDTEVTAIFCNAAGFQEFAKYCSLTRLSSMSWQEMKTQRFRSTCPCKARIHIREIRSTPVERRFYPIHH